MLFKATRILHLIFGLDTFIKEKSCSGKSLCSRIESDEEMVARIADAGSRRLISEEVTEKRS